MRLARLREAPDAAAQPVFQVTPVRLWTQSSHGNGHGSRRSRQPDGFDQTASTCFDLTITTLVDLNFVEATRLGGTFVPTQVIRVGDYSILRVRYDDVGNLRLFAESYYIVSGSGVVRLDFAPVFQAAAAVPSDMVVYGPMSGLDFKSLVFHAWTEKRHPTVSAKLACCQGRVEVPFTITHERVIPGVAKYDPDVLPY